MKNISIEELNEILNKHKMWLNDEEGGKRADLKGINLRNADLSNIDLSHIYLNDADLSYADLYNTNLTGAILKNANLSGSDLSYADLKDAFLKNANLRYTDLSGANLNVANLSDTDLSYADLKDATLRGANLSYAILRYTDLSGANLSGANLNYTHLKNIKTSMYTIGYNLACPEDGIFTGYKKANGCLVKLLILEDSKRSSATTVKCRCDKAKVLEITDIDTDEKVEEVKSSYDSKFIYKVGKIVTVEDFDENRWNECSTGIHFFMNKENALNY